jgi:hypothetical protein
MKTLFYASVFAVFLVAVSGLAIVTARLVSVPAAAFPLTRSESPSTLAPRT